MTRIAFGAKKDIMLGMNTGSNKIGPPHTTSTVCNCHSNGLEIVSSEGGGILNKQQEH